MRVNFSFFLSVSSASKWKGEFGDWWFHERCEFHLHEKERVFTLFCHFMQDENWKNFCQSFSKRVLQMGQNYFPTRQNNCGGGQCTSTSTKSSWLHNLQRHLQLLGELFQHLVNSKNWYDKKNFRRCSVLSFVIFTLETDCSMIQNSLCRIIDGAVCFQSVLIWGRGPYVTS